MKRVRYWN